MKQHGHLTSPTVITDYLIEPGRKNGIAIRVALIRSGYQHDGHFVKPVEA